MQLSWFKNERGSTSLTVVLGIMLSVVLVASSAQWYWTNSSSSDIQTVADIGALAAADVGAQSVMYIQALDALLLTANLFGLVMYGVTIVAGLLSLTPVAPGAAAVFERAMDFNIRYARTRKKLARECHRIAVGINAVTPAMSMAQACRVTSENSNNLRGFNGADYFALTIPFPVVGEVTLSGFSDADDALLEQVNKTGEENRESADEIRRLEDEVEATIDACFAADVYKPTGTQRPYWDPLNAPKDFTRGWTELSKGSAPSVSELQPLSGSDAHRKQLQEAYRNDYRRIVDNIDSELRSVLDRALSSSGAQVQNLSTNSLLMAEKSQRIYLVEHSQGERKAYHNRSNCFGLSNAGQIKAYDLSYVLGDHDHPPCLTCKPVHWQAVESWQNQLAEYVQSWNTEAAALRRWYAAQQNLQQEGEQVQERTKDTFTALMEEAGGYITGGRLSYTPAGARGYLCIVMTSNERELPNYTMPALTNSNNVVLGRQVAMSAARLMPSDSESTIPSLLSTSAETANTNNEGFSRLMRNLMTGDESGDSNSSGVLGSAAALGFVLTIWGSCLDIYSRGSTGLDGLVSDLPFGLDSVFSKAINSFMDVAKISAPDLRRPVPTLINTADIGDAGAGGAEASFVKTIAGIKDVFEKTGGASPAGLRENMSRMLDQLDDDIAKRVDELMQITVLGVKMPLPFAKSVQEMAARAFATIRSKEDELFAAFGL